jgi:nitronate monooxygenase
VTERISTIFSDQLGIDYPIVCGAMFPCSNPELVAAVSEAGGIGVVQPLSMEFIYERKLRDGLRFIRSLTDKPYGVNLTVEKSSTRYAERMERYLNIALEEGCRFFVTSLGKPDWVVKKAKEVDAIVYHKCTLAKHAAKACAGGVDGLIGVTERGGGHAGVLSMEKLYEELTPFKVPLICAGGIGAPHEFVAALNMGYQGILMSTRFIATYECGAAQDYKEAIVRASEDDIVHTERVTGVPIAVIRTPYVDKVGTKIGPIARFLFNHPRTKGWIRAYYNAIAGWRLKRSSLKGLSTRDFYQAGKSVSGISSIVSAKSVVDSFVAEAKRAVS